MNMEILKARDWRRANPLYLDTETTGLKQDAEIVQIAVINDAGNVLIDSLVRPVLPIPEQATNIHGITNEMVWPAPTFAELWPKVAARLLGRTVIIYNSEFDIRMLRQSAAINGFSITGDVEAGIDWQDAMLLYADYRGQWDEFRGSNKWWKLTEACQQMGIQTRDVMAYSAAGDCELTRRLVCKLSAIEAWKVPA